MGPEMKTLLRVDASARIEGSHSRMLADFFQHCWQEANPEGRVIHRDLALNPVPHLSGEEIIAFKDKAENSKAALSNKLCAEVLKTDHILIDSPLYNLSLPSTLKAWLDHIARPGLTFDVVSGKYVGLLNDTNATVVTTRDSIYKPTICDDFQSDYLKAFFSMLGISNIHLVKVDGTSLRPEDRENIFLKAKNEIVYALQD